MEGRGTDDCQVMKMSSFFKYVDGLLGHLLLLEVGLKLEAIAAAGDL